MPRPSYFPGVPRAEEAQLIRLGAGDQLDNLDVVLPVAPAVRIGGRAFDLRGQPLSNGFVNLTQTLRGPGTTVLQSFDSTVTAADGTFLLDSVPPGEYRIEVLVLSPTGTVPVEGGTAALTVTGDDIRDLSLVSTSGWSFQGRISIDSVDTEGQFPFSPTLVRVVGRALRPEMAPRLRLDPAGGRVAADGTFAVTGLFGPQLIRLASVPEGWGLKAVYRGRREVTDEPLDAGPGNLLDGLTITLTNKLSVLSGFVSDRQGRPAPDKPSSSSPTSVRYGVVFTTGS